VACERAPLDEELAAGRSSGLLLYLCHIRAIEKNWRLNAGKSISYFGPALPSEGKGHAFESRRVRHFS